MNIDRISIRANHHLIERLDAHLEDDPHYNTRTAFVVAAIAEKLDRERRKAKQ